MFRTKLTLAALVVAFGVTGLAAQAEEKPIGADEYAMSCAACHGTDGTGHGEFAKVLTVAPSDLTALGRNNGGVFPLEQVYQTIDGRRVVAGHGGRDMPIWGARYLIGMQGEFDPQYAQADAELAVRARILSLIYYIQTLQRP